MSGRMKEADDATRTTRTAYIPKSGDNWEAQRGISGHRKPMKAQGGAPHSDEPGARAGKRLKEIDWYEDEEDRPNPRIGTWGDQMADMPGKEQRHDPESELMYRMTPQELRKEILNLAHKSGMSPQEYLQSLGIGADHFASSGL